MEDTTPRVVTSHKLEAGVGNCPDRAAGLGTVALEDIGLELAMMLGATLKEKHRIHFHIAVCSPISILCPFFFYFVGRLSCLQNRNTCRKLLLLGTPSFISCNMGINTKHISAFVLPLPSLVINCHSNNFTSTKPTEI